MATAGQSTSTMSAGWIDRFVWAIQYANTGCTSTAILYAYALLTYGVFDTVSTYIAVTQLGYTEINPLIGLTEWIPLAVLLVGVNLITFGVVYWLAERIVWSHFYVALVLSVFGTVIVANNTYYLIF